MGGKKPLRRPLWPPTRATASNYYPLGLDGAGGAAKPLLRAPKKPAPLHGRLPAFSGAVDAFERAWKCFLEWRYFSQLSCPNFSKIVSRYIVGALSSGRDAETGQKKPGADFQKVLEAFLQVEEPYLHAVRPEAGRWEYAGGILGVRSSVAWIVWDAQHFGVPQRRRRVFLVADFAGYSAIPILAIPDSVPGYSAPRRVPRQIAATLIGSSFAYAGRA